MNSHFVPISEVTVRAHFRSDGRVANELVANAISD